MASIISNVSVLKGMGVLADRSAKSSSLELRQYNLIYGFNGSGKSTISRLFASLEAGASDPKLPSDGSFSFDMSDGVVHSSAGSLAGLEKRVLVFNGDFVEKNLQWTLGKANPVFFIGANQAEAAAKLAKLEEDIGKLKISQSAADKAEKVAEKALGAYKRDAAKLTAERLHLGSRKYEANHLQADYDKWSEKETQSLDGKALISAEDMLRVEKAADPLLSISYDAPNIPKVFEYVRNICRQALSSVALEEVQKHPDMLLWIKTGEEYHSTHRIEECLFCGNKITPVRLAALATSLDNQIDEFVGRIDRTIERLQANISQLTDLERALPTSDAFQLDLAVGYRDTRAQLVSAIRTSIDHFQRLNLKLGTKRSKPASPADMSDLPTDEEVTASANALIDALEAANSIIERHNAVAADFQKHRQDAEEAIRKHYISECRSALSEHISALSSAQELKTSLGGQIEKAEKDAEGKRPAWPPLTKSGPELPGREFCDAVDRMICDL